MLEFKKEKRELEERISKELDTFIQKYDVKVNQINVQDSTNWKSVGCMNQDDKNTVSVTIDFKI
jgi:uncharacterized protein YlxP (DUF503 family)